MPGIPKSQRCLSCKKRKIKCDLEWPSCTPCTKAGLQCSGPSTTTKFIHDAHVGSHQTIPSRRSSRDNVLNIESYASKEAQKRPTSIVAINTRDVEGGASYGYFRLSSGPKRYPTTLSDRLAAQLVRAIERDQSGQLLINANYMKFLPARMSNSAALRDCVALFCAAWSGYRREAPVAKLLPPSVYGRALRSLQRALHSPDEQLSCETLAAITVLERCNVLFDCDRSHRPIMHAKGIENIMRARGPPKGNDNLDLQLALDNHGILLGFWVVEGGENFYLTPQWKEAMERLTAGSDVVQMACGQDIVLNNCFGLWPKLVKNIREVLKDPQSKEMQHLAADTHQEATDLLQQSHEIYTELVRAAYNDDMLSKAPFWECEECEDPEFQSSPEDLKKMERFTGYITLEIMLTRMLYTLSSTSGWPAEDSHEQCVAACRLSWHMVPYLRKLGSIAAMLYMTPCYISYEVVENDFVKDLLLEFFHQTNVKKVLPSDRQKMEVWLLNTARSMTGRPLLGEDTRVSASLVDPSLDESVLRESPHEDAPSEEAAVAA